MSIVKRSIVIFAFLVIGMGIFHLQSAQPLPVVAIANWGPHASLEASIEGLKAALAQAGYIENKTIRYEIADVGFDPTLIPQMISQLKSTHPKVMVVMSTPVAQFAKGQIHDIPLVYNVITDPIEAGLIKMTGQALENVTGSSDKQDLSAMLAFAKKLIPQATRVGMLYATAESNDRALVNMMQAAGAQMGIKVIAVPVDSARDVPMRMQMFKNKVDFIYVGTSGPIQPTLPVIAAESKKMGIPVFNVQETAVKAGWVLASFGVNYQSVGFNAGKLVASLLNGTDIKTLAPLYPTLNEHQGFINKKQAIALSLTIPDDLPNLHIVE